MQDAPVHVAIIGSGPSGFYAAEALQQSIEHVHIDMYDRLPTPFGLVRAGVAPDHPKLKDVSAVFERIMRLPRFRFMGNVAVGRDIGLADLRSNYQAVILAYGASAARKLGIPGETLRHSHSATEFVGWYNGHPDFRDVQFDLSQEVAVVVGHGNVAADVCRILLTPPSVLATTDIAAHALDVLRESRIREVHLVGRRGPAQAKFTPKELRGLGLIPGCTAMGDETPLTDACRAELADRMNVNSAKNVEILQGFADRRGRDERRLVFHFCLEPQEIEGGNQVERIVFRRTRLEGPPFKQRAVALPEELSIDCSLVLASVGYHGSHLQGAPFDPGRGIVPNDHGRVLEAGRSVPGLYVTGWLKRGATGIIGNNRADSIETVHCVVEDLARSSRDPCGGYDPIEAALAGADIKVVDAEDWCRIDAVERARGLSAGKPREKFTRVGDMLRSLDAEHVSQENAKTVCAAGTREAFRTGTANASVAVGS